MNDDLTWTEIDDALPDHLLPGAHRGHPRDVELRVLS